MTVAQPGTGNEDDYRELLGSLRRWNRWGQDDERGAVNLITEDKTRRAAHAVRHGRTVSLSRPIATAPAPDTPYPAQHYMRRRDRGDGTTGAAVDYLAIAFHGQSTTHIDALCHMWNRDGMWNGRDPDVEITFDRANFGGIHHWAGGIVTRGVLLDVAAGRANDYVDETAPVTSEELREICERTDLVIDPGDALVVYSGRENWERATGMSWGEVGPDKYGNRPGLDVSCIEFFHDVDCSLVVWDMMDAMPNRYGVFYATHGALFTLGIGLLDNAYLRPLATACRQFGQSDFLLIVSPLNIEGGTGSPVNPLAVL